MEPQVGSDGNLGRSMNVVFLSPNYPPEMQQYTRGLAEVGARVLGVGTGRFTPRELLDSGADYAVEDLSDTAGVIQVLLD